ncbi:MAG: hypothetical protein ACP5N3_05160 [Candidatus Nanoarchaeia archaeon]
MIVSKLEAAAVKKGIRTVCLHASITAFDFYERLEYKSIKKLSDKNFGKSFLMKKRLF